MSAVLDTHVLVWWVTDPDRLTPAMRAALDGASAEDPLIVPDICLWEIATLVSLGRLRPQISLGEWLRRAVAPPLVTTQRITPEIAAEVAALPDTFHRDPGDRLIVATARVLGLPLLTMDARIQNSGLVRVIA